jgi:tetratricopeptide (TPR) repeat protein
MLSAFVASALTTVNAIATDWLLWAAAGVVACATSTQRLAGVSPHDVPTGARLRRPRSASAPLTTTTRTILASLCIGIGFVVALTTLSAIDASRAAKASQLERLQGQSQLAIDSGLRATRADSLRPQYWHTLGLAFVSANRFGDAVTAFERASTLASYDVRYDGDLARALAILAQRGDKVSAVRARDVVDRVIRTDPNNPLAYQTRAVTLQFTGELSEALKSSERAIALDRTNSAGYTTNPEIYVTAVQLLNALGRSSEAIVVARRGVAKLPGNPSSVPLRLELARSLGANGQLADALTEVEIAIALQPNDSNAQQLRTQLRAALGN